MARIIFENPSITIFYYEDKDYLFIKWHGFTQSEPFRNAATQILKTIEITKTTSILSDNTNSKVISPNDHGWAAFNWFPQAEAKGIKMLATVLSADYFNRASEKVIEDMAEIKYMKIKNFSSVDEASKWLQESKKLQDY
ncbi:MAG: hypothetical protein ABIR06_17955 [Cyclobacteriaceae bacterium]